MNLFAVLVSLIAYAGILAGPPFYSAKPLEAQVVDAKDGKPIEGALVIAQWILDGPDGDRIATLKVGEAITGADGKFSISGWGPIPRPMNGVLDFQDPELIIFKPGFAAVRKTNGANTAPGERLWLSERKSLWDKSRIALSPRPASEQQYASDLLFAFRSLRPIFVESECLWRGLPLSISILQVEHERQLATGITLPTVPSSKRLAMLNCKGD